MPETKSVKAVKIQKSVSIYIIFILIIFFVVIY